MKNASRLVNALSFWRIAVFPILVGLIIVRQEVMLGIALGISFLTDAADGWLARRYKVSTVSGAEWDSLGDDLTVLAAVIGMLVFKMDLIIGQWLIVFILGFLFLLYTAFALVRYGRLTSFHTRTAKMAAVAQAVFFTLLFLLPGLPVFVFYIASSLTVFDLLEEIAMILYIDEWESDITGLREILRRERKRKSGDHSHSAR